MSTFLILVGFLGFIITLVMLLIKVFKKKPKKKVGIALGIFFIMFVVGVIYPTSDDEDTNVSEDNPKEEKEVETSSNDNEDNKKDDKEVEKNASTDDVQGKDEGIVSIQTDTNVEEEVDPEEQKNQEADNKEENEAKKKQREIESDKFNIKTAIKDRIDEGDYTSVTIDSITINENLGTEEDGDYIALVNLDFNVKNTRNTGNKVMRMYSDDLAATLANKGIKNVAEIAIFWNDEYNDRSVKYAYEYKNNGFYIMDIAGE